jgi:hypothetical protein
MKADVLLERLESAAAELGVKVSYEQISTSVGATALGRGGLCRVKGQFRVIIDKRASAAERVATLAAALGRFEPELAALDLAPEVRDALADHRPADHRPAPPAARRAS